MEKVKSELLNLKDNPEFKKLAVRVLKLKTEYDALIDDIIDLYADLPFERVEELPGKRQPKIIKKMYNFRGDLTPSMLVSLVKDVRAVNSNF